MYSWYKLSRVRPLGFSHVSEPHVDLTLVCSDKLIIIQLTRFNFSIYYYQPPTLSCHEIFPGSVPLLSARVSSAGTATFYQFIQAHGSEGLRIVCVFV